MINSTLMEYYLKSKGKAWDSHNKTTRKRLRDTWAVEWLASGFVSSRSEVACTKWIYIVLMPLSVNFAFQNYIRYLYNVYFGSNGLFSNKDSRNGTYEKGPFVDIKGACIYSDWKGGHLTSMQLTFSPNYLDWFSKSCLFSRCILC